MRYQNCQRSHNTVVEAWGEVLVVHSEFSTSLAGYGTDCHVSQCFNHSFLVSFVALCFWLPRVSAQIVINAFLVPCAVEYESQLLHTLYCMLQINGITITSGSVILYCMYQIYGTKSWFDTARLRGARSLSPNYVCGGTLFLRGDMVLGKGFHHIRAHSRLNLAAASC